MKSPGEFTLRVGSLLAAFAFASAFAQAEDTPPPEIVSRTVPIPYLSLDLAPEDFEISPDPPPVYDLSELFAKFGLVSPEGSSIHYFPKSGEVVIRNTKKNASYAEYLFHDSYPLESFIRETEAYLKATAKPTAEVATDIKDSRISFDPILRAYVLELEKVKAIRRRLIKRDPGASDELTLLDTKIKNLNEGLTAEIERVKERLPAQMEAAQETIGFLAANRIVGNRPATESLLKAFRPETPVVLAHTFAGSLPATESNHETALEFNSIVPRTISIRRNNFDPFSLVETKILYGLTHSEDGGKTFRASPYELRKSLPSAERIRDITTYGVMVDLLGKPTVSAHFADRHPSLNIESDYWLLFQPLTHSSLRVLQVEIPSRSLRKDGTFLRPIILREATFTARKKQP